MSKKQKQTSKPWSAAQPYLLGGAQSLQDTFNQNQPQLQANAALINQQLPGLAERAFSLNPAISAGQNYATDVIGGKYLDQGNPYLQGMINQTAGDVSDRVNSLFGGAGRTGGTQHAQILTRELANAENQLRYGDYGSERDRMLQASALTPSLNAGQYAGISPLLQSATVGGGLPYIGTENLAQGFGSLFSGTGSTTQKPGLGQTLANAAGLGLMAFAPGFGGIKL